MVGRWLSIAVVGLAVACGDTSAGIDAPKSTITPPNLGGFGGFGGPGRTDKTTDDKIGELTRAIASDVGLRGGRNISMALVVDGELAFADGVVGAVDGRTLYSLGSASEIVTVAAIMALIDERRLSLDAPLAPLVTDLTVEPAAARAELTMHRVLTHTSGLGFPDNAAMFPIDWRAPAALSALYESATFPMWSPPGRVYNRQWMNASFAGHVSEVVTGEYFTDVVRTRVFEPLGMSDATYEIAAVESRPHTRGRTGSQASNTEVPLVHPGFAVLPMSGLHASASDLGLLAQHLLADERMMTPHFDTQSAYSRRRGYGVMVWDDDGLRIAATTDRSAGFASLIMFAPTEGFAIALLGDCDWYDLSLAAYRAFELFLGKRITLFQGSQTSAVERAAFDGSYVDPHRFGRVTVSATTNGLRMQFLDFEHETEATQLSKNVFWFSTNDRMRQVIGAGQQQTIVTFFEDPLDGRRYFVTAVGVAAAE